MSNLQVLTEQLVPDLFDQSEYATVQGQINVRAAWVWAQEDWPFKHTIDADLTVGGQTVDVDEFFGPICLRPERIYDDQGDKLQYREFSDLRRQTKADPVTRRPEAWSWQGRSIYFDSTPDVTYTFTMDYARRLYHCFDSGGGEFLLVAGKMSDPSSDNPAWAQVYESDLWLAAGAGAALLKMRNDPSFAPLEDEFQGGYLAMVNELIPDRPPESLQYGMERF